jgi:hypothetical protein
MRSSLAASWWAVQKVLPSLLTLLLFSGSLTMIPIQKAMADSKVADCLELRFPTYTSSATSFKLEVSVYAICDSAQLGRGNGQRPVYEMVEEDSLLNLGNCSGPSAAAQTGAGKLGTVTCTLRVGDNSFFPSPRVGATSTTIKMWFAWDFSTKSIAVPHKPIPGKTATGSGSTTAVPKAPITPSCKAAPSPPKITSVISSQGLQVIVTPSTEGDRPQALAWATTYYSRDAQTWESWSKWNDVQPPREITFLAESSSTRQKIAIQAYSYNACGSSANAREAADNKGIEILTTADIDSANELNDALKSADLAEESLAKIEAEISLATREADAMTYQLNEKIGQIITDLQKMIKDLSTIIAKMAKN